MFGWSGSYVTCSVRSVAICVRGLASRAVSMHFKLEPFTSGRLHLVNVERDMGYDRLCVVDLDKTEKTALFSHCRPDDLVSHSTECLTESMSSTSVSHREHLALYLALMRVEADLNIPSSPIWNEFRKFSDQIILSGHSRLDLASFSGLCTVSTVLSQSYDF